jgi:hypothetical protein
MKTATITLEEILAEQMRLAGLDLDAGGMSSEQIIETQGLSRDKTLAMLRRGIRDGTIEARQVRVLDMAGRPNRSVRYFAVQKSKKK